MKLTCVITLLWALNLPAALPQGAGQVQTRAVRPNPVLVFMGSEDYEAGGKEFTRYWYAVDNLSEYPNEMFAAAPELPPCGGNAKASRTWVDLYEQGGKRLYGFCALENRDGLGRLWFAVERGVVPPSWIYVELNDRQTNSKYKSNLAETTM